MKRIFGTTAGFSISLLCKVVESLVENSEVQIFRGVSSKKSGYISVYFISQAVSQKTAPTPNFQFLNDEPLFTIGDIYLVEPSGVATLCFGKNNNDNSIVLTDECNCHCIMCPQGNHRNIADSTEQALEMIDMLDVSVPVLGITGGEPTLRWKGLVQVLSACDSNLPETCIQLLTNGRVLKDFDKAKELSVSGGENLMVCIPIYGDVDSVHDLHMGEKGAFWDSVQALHNLGHFKTYIEIRVLITKHNYDRLESISNFIYRSFPFVDHIAFMGLETIGMAAKNIKSLWVEPSIYSKSLKLSCKYLARRGFNVSIYNHPICVLPSELWRFSRHSISEWKVNYYDECEDCIQQINCGGVFFSSKKQLAKCISPIYASMKTEEDTWQG